MKRQVKENTTKQKKFLGHFAPSNNWKFLLVPSLFFFLGFQFVSASNLKPLSEKDFLPVNQKKVKLGRLLFYDPILSGNRNISCGTCHNHIHHGADGLSLGVGEGGVGLGPDRTAGKGNSRIQKRIPRNSPSLFNLGAHQIKVMFYDGKLSPGWGYENGFNSPAEEWLGQGLDNLLAAQSLLPMASEFEMAGNSGENQVAGAIYDRIDQGWPILTKRVRTIPEYGKMFVEAFDDIQNPSDVRIFHIGNALSEFINFEWRSYDSPFDEFLMGHEEALNSKQKKGMELFYGKAQCAQCHQGILFTDQKFYALAIPQFGPGRTRPFDPYVRDVGRMVETDRLEDAYRFRTPSLRNVAVTAPYGHNGAYADLEGIIRHHLDPLKSLENWDPKQVILADAPWLSEIDFVVLEDRFERERLKSHLDITPISITENEIAQIISFLEGLTGENSIHGELGKPDRVPSGLPID